MGLIRTEECAQIDAEMARLFPAFVGDETRKDEYSEDFIVWLHVDDELHAIRVTIDEYRDGDWVENLKAALEALGGSIDPGISS
jgi:hypothetical protein